MRFCLLHYIAVWCACSLGTMFNKFYFATLAYEFSNLPTWRIMWSPDKGNHVRTRTRSPDKARKEFSSKSKPLPDFLICGWWFALKTSSQTCKECWKFARPLVDASNTKRIISRWYFSHSQSQIRLRLRFHLSLARCKNSRAKSNICFGQIKLAVSTNINCNSYK